MGELSRRDRTWAVGIGLLTLALFVVTLRPGVGGPEDSPKFQFVGRVLGTAHSPGYPLYVVLTYLFGWLPGATLAYRINLFSALLAAIACTGAFVIGRQLGASRWASAIMTLGLATGMGFWRNAIVAEVYSLAAALVAVVIALLLWWDRSTGACTSMPHARCLPRALAITSSRWACCRPLSHSASRAIGRCSAFGRLPSQS